MNSEKPENVDDYKKWLEEKHKIDIRRTQTHYDSVTAKIKQDFEKTIFWVQITESLRKYDQEYLLKTGYPLLISTFEPELQIKTFESLLLKTFRKNIIENELFPDEPKDGWILPKNWYSRINDILRTLFVVKYFDGVEFMISKIESLCAQHSMKCRVFLEAREEGYYAAHLYTKQNFEIPKVNWDTERVDVPIEIQITTQLQEVIRKLLHKYYERARKRIRKEDVKWQWDCKCDEFAANYLGHILHYIEGMIMEIRERQKELIP